MDYIEDLRDPNTLARLLPYMEMAASQHSLMHDAINTITHDPTGMAATYAADCDLLRAAIERVLRRQREVFAKLVEVEQQAEVEADKLIGQALGLPAERRIDRRPFGDEMDN